MGSVTDVRIGADGIVYLGTENATLPTSTTSDPTNAGFTDLGFISEDGVTETQDASVEKIKNMAGATVRVVQTEHSLMYQFKLIESNEDVLAAYYGADPEDGISGVMGARAPWVIDVFDGDAVVRICVPDGAIIERADVMYSNGEPIAFDVTVECYPDDSGNKVYIYRSDTGS